MCLVHVHFQISRVFCAIATDGSTAYCEQCGVPTPEHMQKKEPAAQHQAAQKSRTRAEPTTNNSPLNSTAPGEEEQEHPTRPAISVPMTRFNDSSPSHPATHSTAPRQPPPRRPRSEGGEADHQERVHQGSADEEDEIANEENESACAGTQWR